MHTTTTPATLPVASYNPKVVDSPRDIDDDEFDFEYFTRTYKPLSNLPTPPPSSRNSVSSSPVLGDEEFDDDVDTALLGMCFPLLALRFYPLWRVLTNQPLLTGPAVHLVNLHPPSASIDPPSVALIQTILTRAALPLETIALAVCILDSLDAKFARKWRVTLPLAATTKTTALSKRHTITSAAASLITHIDSVRPELVILAALVVAFKFTEDCQEPTQYYAGDWGRGLWTCGQINATERCIMEHLGYRILPLCQRDIIADAIEDMRRAGQVAAREREEGLLRAGAAAMGPNGASPRLEAGAAACGGHVRSISVPVRHGMGAGEAVVGLGFLTPVDTPTEERSMQLGAP